MWPWAVPRASARRVGRAAARSVKMLGPREWPPASRDGAQSRRAAKRFESPHTTCTSHFRAYTSVPRIALLAGARVSQAGRRGRLGAQRRPLKRGGPAWSLRRRFRIAIRAMTLRRRPPTRPWRTAARAAAAQPRAPARRPPGMLRCDARCGTVFGDARNVCNELCLLSSLPSGLTRAVARSLRCAAPHRTACAL